MRRRLTKKRRVALALVLVLALAWSCAGCTSTITPPRFPVDPVSVYLVHDARHRGVVLPARDGGFVEYGYGDWDWYALNYDAWYNAFDTILWPTQGTLGRLTSHATDYASFHAERPWRQLSELRVERDAMQRVRDGLALEFASRAGEQVHNARYRMDFVPCDPGYWCLFNCNDQVAAWCERLGCKVSWVPLCLDVVVVPTPDRR